MTMPPKMIKILTKKYIPIIIKFCEYRTKVTMLKPMRTFSAMKAMTLYAVVTVL